ncbi:FAD-dependent oxidoreductase [Streptomyces sp. NPDC052236]|uniref:glycerol-3-phosphate dehydrogenase/oxidase n=1 Tax=Streptomyces sp. NPDC052236 TaxID=3365686 RepID=UPI0037CD0893
MSAADAPRTPGPVRAPDRSRLNAASRTAALRAATSGEVDLVVIGGGVTGAGCALDAAARGLSVVLVEAGDLAAGTSSRSGKTFHGGLRYLEQLNFPLVSTALRERDLMVGRLCPHLTRPEPFLYPLTRHWERAYAGAGILLYDIMARRGRAVPRHRHFTRTGALRQAPALNPRAITGGIQYFDVRVDDARHTMTLARTASEHGAQIIPRARVVEVLRHGVQVTGVTVEDTLTARLHGIQCRAVINATGVWSAGLQQLAGDSTFSVRPAKGVHLVVARETIDSATGILARAEDSIIVIRRWWDHWIVGTTDTPWDGPLGEPVAGESDIDYLLRNTNRYLRTPLRRRDVVGVYAGLRPLLTPAGSDTAATSALSRDHSVLPGPEGMVTIVGGKYTTYRPMAADAVDAAVRWIGRDIPPSRTAFLQLTGAADWEAVRGRADALARRHGVHRAHVERMLGRYGDRTDEVLHPVAEDASLGRPVGDVPGYLAAEYLYAVTDEGAMTLEDVLSRRTHVAMEAADGGVGAALRVGRIVAGALGWTEADITAQVAAYAAMVTRDRAAL